MAKAFPSMEVDAVDISPDALEVADINRARADLESRLHLIRSDLFEAIPKRNRYDLVISNPPYVKHSAMQLLPKEYRHEPRQALFGGNDGLIFAKRIVLDAGKFLRPGGLLIVEVGHNRKAFERAFPRLPVMWLDTAGGADMVALIEREDLRGLNQQ